MATVAAGRPPPGTVERRPGLGHDSFSIPEELACGVEGRSPGFWMLCRCAFPEQNSSGVVQRTHPDTVAGAASVFHRLPSFTLALKHRAPSRTQKRKINLVRGNRVLYVEQTKETLCWFSRFVVVILEGVLWLLLWPSCIRHFQECCGRGFLFR